ncbi:MAG: aminomethyl transferase family protein [Desulfobacterales bacterium]|nr:aminomethyl transferase family protein [Desulfobacterales bacterium]MCP4162724.1 aminomethyl transferase family protein [Deltaproteobacteria bacterium]
MQDKVKATKMHEWHMSNGANMGNFGNYDMPLWYPKGAKEEHLSVVTAAGLFDTSHMAAVTVTGEHAFDLLQLCFSKDLNSCIGKSKTPIEIGKCVYGVFLDEEGGVIDDAIVYKLETNIYMIVVNAAMGGTIAATLESKKENNIVMIEDLTDKLGKMDVQGPNSAKILSKIIKNPEKVFESFGYFNFKGHHNDASMLSDDVRLLDGTPILLSRTGYTGEFGFEIFVDENKTLELWEKIIEAGAEFDLVPCGLASRDSLRAGAVLPLSHQDIGSWPFSNNPWHFALPYNVTISDFTKDFVGASALKNIKDRKYTYPFAGFDLRKIATENSKVLDESGNEIGTVLTCATDMAIGRSDGKIYSITSPDKPEMKIKGLCCGFVQINTLTKSGQTIYLSDGKRKLKVEIRSDVRPDRTARKRIKDMI